MRLPRPHVPLSVRVMVAMRQLGITCEVRDGTWSSLLADLLPKLALTLGCEVKELRLDHNPALAVRVKVHNKGGDIIGYIPHANDPDHLIYRTKQNHHIKTNVSGDGAQFPDRVLIKRERRRERPPRARPKKAWPSRPFPKVKRKLCSRGFKK